MNKIVKIYTIGNKPEEHDFRICPECGNDTLEWIIEDVDMWSCSCGYEESAPEDWSVPLPEGMIFCADDGSDEHIVKSGKLGYIDGDKE